METILVKIFATALALSQVATAPEAVKTQFDRERDQQQVASLLSAGCTHMRKAFDIEDINLDELIATALDDPQALTGEIKAFRGLNFADLHTAYRQFCKNEKVATPAVDLGAVIDFYNKAAADLPDHAKLRGLKLPGASVVLDGKGHRFAEVFEENQRRVWVALSDIPAEVQKAFIAAEDKRFYAHKGIDERGIIRAFIGNLAGSGRPQGGSTITQQVVKNLLVGEDLTYERKIREMIVATRLEQALSKDEILELYLNYVFLGRGAWGIEMAARSYFGKSAKDADARRGRAARRADQGPELLRSRPPPGTGAGAARLCAQPAAGGRRDRRRACRQGDCRRCRRSSPMKPRRDIGFYFVDQVAREAKAAAGIEAITAHSYTVRSTINTQLQRAVEQALQEGLSRYERSSGRAFIPGRRGQPRGRHPPHRSQAQAAGEKAGLAAGAENTRLPLYDVHWTPAVLIEKPGGKKKGEAWRVGLADGRILPLSARQRQRATQARAPRRRPGARERGQEQGGRARGTAGAADRAGRRGRAGEQDRSRSGDVGRVFLSAEPAQSRYPIPAPARLRDQAIELSRRRCATVCNPIRWSSTSRSRCRRSGGGRAASRTTGRRRTTTAAAGGVLTLRRALENSRNLATVRLLEGGIESKPEASLDRLCALAMEAQIYPECVRYYPFVLGAQPVRPIDLAAFYAAIANEGVRPNPHVMDIDRA